MATDHNNPPANKGMMKYIKPLVISLATIVVTAVITWYVPKFLEKPQLEINLQELELSTGGYLYLIDVRNSGRVSVQDVDLSILSDGEVYSSTFNGSPSSHDPYYRLSKSPFNGEVQINDEDTIKTIQYPYSERQHKDSQEAAAALKQYIRQIIRANSSVWYNVNISPFYLDKGETVKASIMTGQQIDTDKIKCLPNPEICKINKITAISKDRFERIFATLSVQQGGMSNKIFANGIGLSSHMIRGSAIAEARQKAIHDFYKDIVQKIYGVDVKASYTSRSQTAAGNDKAFGYSTNVSLSTQGVIDRSAAIIYSERSEKLESGEIVYEVKGYYEIPGNIQTTDDSLKLDASFVLSSSPVELEGERPVWLDENYQFENSIVVSAVGVSDANMPYSLAKQLAKNRAISKLSSALHVEVKSLIKTYIASESINATESVETKVVDSMIKTVADNNLKGTHVIAFYRSADDLVYALAVMPGNLIKWATQEKVRNIIASQPDSMTDCKIKSSHNKDSLWRQFISDQAKGELAKELEAEESP